MRITQRAVVETSLLGLNRNLSAVGKLQQQLTSGKLISTASDDPTGTNTAMQVRQDTRAVAQQARNISDGSSWLDAADTTLSSMLTTVRRVRDLTVQGLNSGSTNEQSRAAIQTEVVRLRDSLLGLANQSINGQPLFGGATDSSVAYDADGAFVGVGGTFVDTSGTEIDVTVPLNRRVSDTEVIRVDITGPEAFGDPLKGRDLFRIVQDIADHVMTAGSGDTALQDDLTALDAAMNRLLTAAADIGTRAKRMEDAATINTDLQLTLKDQLSEVEEIDLPKTMMELNLQKTGYEAALAATAQAIQPSLLDYLR
ncbi:flagellin N-terminal helical domain-containing protein [Blastococcus sp. SYSU D00820]